MQHDDRQRMRDEVVHVAGEPMPLARGGIRQLPCAARSSSANRVAPQEHPHEHAERAAEREVDRAHIPLDPEQERHEREHMMTTVTVPTNQRSSDLLASRSQPRSHEERRADLGEGDDGNHGDDREGREGELGSSTPKTSRAHGTRAISMATTTAGLNCAPTTASTAATRAMPA